VKVVVKVVVKVEVSCTMIVYSCVEVLDKDLFYTYAPSTPFIPNLVHRFLSELALVNSS
jgi:hypothetical protein